jgi:IS30 family transposase
MSHLTEAQRYEISVLKQAGFSQKDIAEKIGKHKSVISKERCAERNDTNTQATAHFPRMCYDFSN